MTNADKFKSIFGLYATELWAKPEKDFLEWLNADVELFGISEQLNDTISRQAAIDALLGITAMRNTIPLDSAIFNIKKLPSAQPERKTGKWIPVTERLPEKKQEVIVTVTRKNGSIFTERDGWTGTGFWGYGHRVIAWMPLPEPYREEGENQ